MSDFLEVKAKKVEIAAGWGKEGSILVLMDVEPDDLDNEADALKLADFLWNTVPSKTIDLAIEELARREEIAREAIMGALRI